MKINLWINSTVLIASISLFCLIDTEFLENDDLETIHGTYQEHIQTQRKSGGKYQFTDDYVLLNLNEYDETSFEIKGLDYLESIDTNLNLNKENTVTVWIKKSDHNFQKKNIRMFGLMINDELILNKKEEIRSNNIDYILGKLFLIFMFVFSIFRIIFSVKKIRANQSVYL